VQDPASAGLGETRFVLLGGLTAADTSSDQVILGTGTSASVKAALPNAQHDAQAAVLGGQVYLFGGGQFAQYAHILAFDPGADHVAVAGSLPAPASDVAVAGGPSTAYVVGGFDGVHWLNTVLAYTPHQPVHVLTHLPVPLRYAAAVVIGHELLIAGGSTPTGASRTIYRVDLATGSVRALGRLPAPITHAGAGALDGEMYLVGGRGDVLTARTSAVYGIDPVTGRIHVAGHLPKPLSDEAVVSASGHLLVAGGASADGTQAAVGELFPRG
jgi:N-acetylneuraminic acid mutarotase